MPDIFGVISDATRRDILRVLLERHQQDAEISVSEIVAQLELSQPTVSKHLKVLREAGLVTVEVRGQQRIYRLDPAGLEAFDAWLSKVRRFWGHHLDILEQELAKPEQGEGDTR